MSAPSDRAEQLLRYYLRTVWEAAGMSWDEDNDAEVGGIVDALCAADEDVAADAVRGHAAGFARRPDGERPSDMDLPGMWEASAFEGGWADTAPLSASADAREQSVQVTAWLAGAAERRGGPVPPDDPEEIRARLDTGGEG